MHSQGLLGRSMLSGTSITACHAEARVTVKRTPHGLPRMSHWVFASFPLFVLPLFEFRRSSIPLKIRVVGSTKFTTHIEMSTAVQ